MFCREKCRFAWRTSSSRAIPPSRPRKYRNERVGGSLREQLTRVARVRERLRATSSVRGIYELRDKGREYRASLARVSSTGKRSRERATSPFFPIHPRYTLAPASFYRLARKLFRFSLVHEGEKNPSFSSSSSTSWLADRVSQA